MTAEGFPQWLAHAATSVVIHADNDDAGHAAASRLCGAVRIHGGTVRGAAASGQVHWRDCGTTRSLR